MSISSTSSIGSDYSRIAAGVPSINNELAAEILRNDFNIGAVALRRLPGETDCNFYACDGAGSEYVLKIAPKDELAAVKLQQLALEETQTKDAELPVPRVIRSTQNDPQVLIGTGQGTYVARVLTWRHGESLSNIPLRSDELLADIGHQAGKLAAAMAETADDGECPRHYWDLRNAHSVIDAGISHITEPELRDSVQYAQSLAMATVNDFDLLPQSLVHHDLNALNILVERTQNRNRVSGIIDFGDVTRTARVSDLAILVASVSRGQTDPLRTAEILTRSYAESVPLTESEVEALFPLVLLRTAQVLVTTERLAAEKKPGDGRHRSSAIKEQLTSLARLSQPYFTAVLRRASGYSPLPGASETIGHIRKNRLHALIAGELQTLNLSASSPVFDDADASKPSTLAEAAHRAVEELKPSIAVRPYGEPSFLIPALRADGIQQAVNTPLGLSFFVGNGTSVFAPADGTIVGSKKPNTVTIRHEPGNDVVFWTRITNVNPSMRIGDAVTAGQIIGHSAQGADASDFLTQAVTAQLLTVDPTEIDVPFEVRRDELPIWSQFSPDPTQLSGGVIGEWQPTLPKALEGRKKYLPETHPTYFEQPINMVRAKDCYFYDEESRAYLDALNNVTLLGHCHPRLTKAASTQLKRLNTNSRFVYDALTEYTEALTKTLPNGLDVVYMLNSGSESNDLALRMARHITGRQDFVIIDDAYHGYTSLVSDVSPSRYKYYGKPDFTHATLNPDRYRGKFGYEDPDAGAHYAQHTIDLFDELIAKGRPPAAFIYEPLLAGGGQVVLPPGYLAAIQAAAKERGILTISDEVQVGFGRLGEAMWGFQTQGPEVVPDFVTMGKAMGNGFPVAAMVTTRENSRRFDENGRFFATYGGNPVASAVALELLHILRDEGLQENALHVGEYFRQQLWTLAERHPLIGDVRGQGFYSGVEFVLDRETKDPAIEETLKICDRLKDRGMLVYPTGRYWNILKLKPPMTFTRQNADTFVQVLDEVLERGW
ncbi:aminotransferase class III-fold pyridoxal phosphate-dependent enzyme [Paenarthrobacter ureafaciens]|uniref:aminotransferase class III-fold pyridoxal phosphate-dependent enzyme n=1 Tax=Paenarthrobacter ureafaciens TaxID=37931 RepID=UPI001C2BD2F1